MKCFARALTVCVAFCVASSASAATLFQSVVDLTASPNVNAWCSSCQGNGFKVFDQFSLNASSTVASVSFAVQTSFSFPTSVNVSVWTSAADQPVAPLFSQTFLPVDFVSVVNTQNDTSIVTVNFLGLLLAAGTYEISFFNSDNLGVPGYTGGSGLLFQEGFGFHEGQSAAFALFNTPAMTATPLPAALPLFAGGLGVIGLLMRRRKQRQSPMRRKDQGLAVPRNVDA